MVTLKSTPLHPKLKVGVIFGGRSGEHEVSLMSAQSVMGALDTAKYEVVPIGITKAGSWVAGEAMLALTSGERVAQAATLLPDPQNAALMGLGDDGSGSRPGTLSTITQLDVIIPVLHGTYGEDGTVQGLLELADLPYVGAGVTGSAVGMDKALFKNVMSANGIPVLPWQLVLKTRWQNDPNTVIDRLEAALPYPMFTKPANLGSSVGISKCDNRAELIAGLNEAASYDRRIVVEQGANIRELEVSVLGNDDPIASVVGEVRPRRDFYDYVAKYVSDDSDLFIPAGLAPEMADRIRTLAVEAYCAIDCAGLSRVDMMLDKDTGDIYINEINTMPGFTRISMYPKLWEATGLSYPALLDRLIELALERHDQKMNLKTTFEVNNL